MTKKAVILFTSLYAEGGIQQYNRDLCRALEEKFGSIEFEAVSLLDRNMEKAAKKWNNINIRTCGDAGPEIIKKALFVFYSISACLSAKPVFLICSHVALSPIALVLKKLFAVKYAVFIYGIDAWPVTGGMKYRGLKNADKVIAISKFTGEKAAANGIDRGRIVYLNNAVDPSVFFAKPVDGPLAGKLGLVGKKVLLTVGRMDPDERYKGHEIMLEVIKRLDDSYIWLSVGNGGDVGFLKKKACDIGVAERVLFIEGAARGALCRYYNLCNCFIMPSRGEGFGTVFLEALACGKPVIGGNADGAREPLMDGKLGFLVDPGNAQEIADTVKNIFEIKDKRTDCTYLRSEVEKNFGINVFTSRTWSIFKECLR